MILHQLCLLANHPARRSFRCSSKCTEKAFPELASRVRYSQQRESLSFFESVGFYTSSESTSRQSLLVFQRMYPLFKLILTKASYNIRKSLTLHKSPCVPYVCQCKLQGQNHCQFLINNKNQSFLQTVPFFYVKFDESQFYPQYPLKSIHVPDVLKCGRQGHMFLNYSTWYYKMV